MPAKKTRKRAYRSQRNTADKWQRREALVRLEAWARDGLSQEEIAQRMGVSRTTLQRWAKKYPLIREAMEQGKDVADIQVENALFHRALGVVKRKRILVMGKPDEETGEASLKVVQEIEEDVPGDVTAQTFWLKNRKPDAWKERRLEEVKVEPPRIVIDQEADYGE